MKKLIFLFSFACFLQGIQCNDGLLAKFHQTGYKLKDTRFQLMSFNESYFNIYEIKAFKYNRTTTAHNFTFNIKIDAKDKIEVVVQANKFLSNEYRHFPLRFQVNIRKAVNSNAVGLRSFYNCGNLTDMYLYKNVTYHACNFVVDETRCPPLIPDGKYRIDLTFLYLNAEMALLSWFTEVYTPIPYPKK